MTRKNITKMCEDTVFIHIKKTISDITVNACNAVIRIIHYSTTWSRCSEKLTRTPDTLL